MVTKISPQWQFAVYYFVFEEAFAIGISFPVFYLRTGKLLTFWRLLYNMHFPVANIETNPAEKDKDMTRFLLWDLGTGLLKCKELVFMPAL